MPIISKRIENFKLEREFARYEFSTRYMASSSDAETMSVGALVALAGKKLEDFSDIPLGYTDSHGSLELRKEIAKKYKGFDPSMILVHVGAEEAIFNFFQAVLKAGDHIVVHTPCYQSFLSVPQSLGIEISEWRETWENQFKVSVKDLEKLIRPNTKAVFINFPHNPTGSVLQKEEQVSLISLLRAKDIFLFSDEVYEGIEFESHSKVPPICEIYENALSLGVLSKAYGLAGLRLGWIATQRKDIYQAMAAQKDYTTICHSPLVEALALVALQNEKQIVARNLQITQNNVKVALSFLQKWNGYFEWVPPLGSTMMFPRAKDLAFFEKFWNLSLDNYGVFIVRGTNFGMPANYFRFGMGRKDFSQVIELLDNCMKELNS